MSELIDNQKKQRRDQLRRLIRELHEGRDKASVEKDFKDHFGEVDTSEIADLEQALIREGLPVEEIQKLCDVHASIMGTNVSDLHKHDAEQQAGHPLHVLKTENTRAEKLLDEEIDPYLTQEGNMALLMLRVGMDRLKEIEKHYARKETLFFPYLEKKGITGPPQVMWGVDDEIRAEMKAVRTLLDHPDVTVAEVNDRVKAVTQKVRDMVFKENNILIPLLAEELNLYNFIQIAEASDEIGYFLEAPEDSWRADTEEEITVEDTTPGTVRFDAGELEGHVVNAIMNTLPLDLTFVDANGYVRYFTQGEERIFERPITILGRHVNMCHPPASVHVVETIVENFKTGKKDHEDFWIQFRDRFVHIRYFAVRDKDETYLGTLEMTQDIKPIRELEGEKRLMDK